MTIEIKVPVLPESVADATVATWHKKPGDTVKRDENLVDIETDKVMLEVPAPRDGVLEKIIKDVGSTVTAQEVLGIIKEGAPSKEAAGAPSKETSKPQQTTKTQASAAEAGPAARRAAAEHDIDLQQIKGTGKDSRVTKEDVTEHAKAGPAPSIPGTATKDLTGRPEQRVPMTRLRARIAERLLSAQHNAAILTTFNEVNMQAVMDTRARYKDQFEKSYGVKLGFMSFFTRAVVEALKRFPAVNASIDGNDIVYHGYFDVGIAVSTDRGLVVPILRDADKMSFAQIEAGVADFGKKARNGQLTMEEITGGTFTITNGGIFGSLFATPILNPPQSAILGMHKIQDRPIAEKGQVVIRPMMYIALSYDHRIIDGKESVQFLVTVKELLEDPARLLLDV